MSANDYTDADKQKVNAIDNKVDKEDGKVLSTNDYTNADKGAVGSIINKVDKIDGKGLSTNDYTNEDKKKLNSLSNYVHPSTHWASMIVFEDGDTLQKKFNKNELFTLPKTTQL